MVQSSGANTCKWLLAVPDGFAVEISFESFDLLCGSGSLKVYDGKDETGNLIGTFCGTNNPTVLVSADKNLYIVYSSTAETPPSSFKANWKKFASKYHV